MSNFTNAKEIIRKSIEIIDLDLKKVFEENRKYLDSDGCITKEFIDRMGGINTYNEMLELQTIVKSLEEYNENYMQ